MATESAPAPAPALDLDAFLAAQATGTDPRQVEAGKKILRLAETDGVWKSRNWPQFPADRKIAKVQGFVPIYEGDRDAIRHILSRAAQSLGYEIGAQPGQFRVDFRIGTAVVEHMGSVERVCDAVVITHVEKKAKAKVRIERPARF